MRWSVHHLTVTKMEGSLKITASKRVQRSRRLGRFLFVLKLLSLEWFKQYSVWEGHHWIGKQTFDPQSSPPHNLPSSVRCSQYCLCSFLVRKFELHLLLGSPRIGHEEGLYPSIFLHVPPLQQARRRNRRTEQRPAFILYFIMQYVINSIFTWFELSLFLRLQWSEAH